MDKAKSTLKGSPAYKAAVADAHVESFGKCITKADDGKLSGPCAKDEAHVKCKACQADVTIPGYCAGHKGISRGPEKHDFFCSRSFFQA